MFLENSQLIALKSTRFSVAYCHKNNLSTLLFNTLNAKLNPTCHLLALLGAHHILHISRI